MNQKKRDARVAGLWYLAMALCGPFGIVYVPSQIWAPADATTTLANLQAHEMLLRLGVASNLLCQVIFVFLVLALCRLFLGVSAVHEKLMKSLVIAAVPIAMLNELWQLGALRVAQSALTPDQQREWVDVFFRLHDDGIAVASIFWGLWLFPFGILALRSGFIPKLLGVLLIVGCFSYLIDSSLALLLPAARVALTDYLMLPLAAGELAMVLWLLIKGVRDETRPLAPVLGGHP